jgi:hypothetical protein
MGQSALQSASTSSNSTAIGFQALLNNNGSNNTAVGTDSLKANTTGVNNVAMGKCSLFTNTTASCNTAVGFCSLKDNTTGALNTAVGFCALRSNTTGGCNVFVGVLAGETVTTGGKNTGIGYDVGGSGSYSNKIMVGYQVSVSNDGNDEIVIGREIAGLGGQSFTFGKPSNKVYNIFTSNASWTRLSDERLKTNIKTSNLGLDFINRLQPKTYQWRPSYDVDPTLVNDYNEVNQMDTEVKMNGLIAQEVKQALLDSGVSETDLETYGVWTEQQDGAQAISREMFIMPLINAIKELKTQNEDLKSRIEALET